MSRYLREDGQPFRRPTNVSLDAGLVREARELSINISRACEEGLAQSIREARARQWREANREALAFVERLRRGEGPAAPAVTVSSDGPVRYLSL